MKRLNNKKKQPRKQYAHHHPAVLVSISIILLSLFLAGKLVMGQEKIRLLIIKLLPPPDSATYTGAKQNLQLRTFAFITLPPPPVITLAPPASFPPQSNTTPPPNTSVVPSGRPIGKCDFGCTGDQCIDDKVKPTPEPGKPACVCPGEEVVACNTFNRDASGFGSCPDNGVVFIDPTQFEVDTVCVYTQINPAYPKYKAILDNPGSSSIHCQSVCFAKPVIYLYPTKPTNVSVKLTIPGAITVSDPLYPVKTGWENVLAQPNGTLNYQGKTYRELFYETSVSKHEVPPTGIIIPAVELEARLRAITSQLGLLPKEQQEFLDYWLPSLKHLHSPYILFSILTPAQKEAVDHVTITPRPDTMIAFLAYFKPLQQPVNISPLELPKTPPHRIGFTAVEWGGTIDQSTTNIITDY